MVWCKVKQLQNIVTIRILIIALRMFTVTRKNKGDKNLIRTNRSIMSCLVEEAVVFENLII